MIGAESRISSERRRRCRRRASRSSRKTPWSKPSPKISQPALTWSIRIWPERLLEVGRDVRDADADDLAIEQFAQRHAAAAPFAQRDDDLVDPESHRPVFQRTRGRSAPDSRRRCSWDSFGPGTKPTILTCGLAERDRPGDELGRRAGAEDQDARERPCRLLAEPGTDPMGNDAGDAEHRQPSQLLPAFDFGRQDAEYGVRQQQREDECQRRADARMVERVSPCRPVQARGGVDEQKSGEERKALRGRNDV